VLFVGRLDRIKGLDILLTSIADVGARLRERIRLLVVGHDVDAERKQVNLYRRMAARLGIADCVEFRGVVPQSELPLYYSAADVLAVPSAYESFGMAAVEAMACGTPVVAFRVGGLQATVRDGQTGFLARAGDRRDFTATLQRALTAPDLQSIGRHARMAAQRYRWENVTRDTIDLYRQALRSSFASQHAAGAV
jgi:D-inositol-3-phosphate glycosyltransferase